MLLLPSYEASEAEERVQGRSPSPCEANFELPEPAGSLRRTTLSFFLPGLSCSSPIPLPLGPPPTCEYSLTVDISAADGLVLERTPADLASPRPSPPVQKPISKMAAAAPAKKAGKTPKEFMGKHGTGQSLLGKRWSREGRRREGAPRRLEFAPAYRSVYLFSALPW